MRFIIPERLASFCGDDAGRSAWLARLPSIVAELRERWSFELEAPFDGGSCAWVAPVMQADGANAVLKVGVPHMEAAQEIAGLRFWNGRATVRLLEADESLHAMLLERCVPGTALQMLPELEQDVVLADLLLQLRRPPVTSEFRPLTEMLDHWTAETLAARDEWPDHALVQAGLDLFHELAESTQQLVLLFTDLHAGNVLRAQRSPWLAIDPKPFAGDPAYDATQHLMNCSRRMRSDPHATITSFANLLGLSPDRVRFWMFARAAAEPRRLWRDDIWLDVARSIAP